MYLQHQQQHQSHRKGGWKVDELDDELKDMKRLAEEEEEREVIPQGGGKKRKHEQSPVSELPSEQLYANNQTLKRCKEEFIEDDHADMQQMISAVEAAAQCSICCDTMKQASTVSGCGHTFCRSCVEEALH